MIHERAQARIWVSVCAFHEATGDGIERVVTVLAGEDQPPAERGRGARQPGADLVEGQDHATGGFKYGLSCCGVPLGTRP